MHLLPPELLRHIIAFIWHHEDREGCFPTLYSDGEASTKDTILACSRASFVFRQMTQPFLFHTLAISLRPPMDYNDDPSSGCSCRHLSELGNLACSLPAVYHNVRELRLRGWCSACRERQSKQVEIQAIDSNVLLSSLSKFKGLRNLHMQDLALSWESQTPPSIEPSPDVRPVHTLDSFSYAFSTYHWYHNVTNLEPLLKTFIRAGRISFHDVAFDRGDDWRLRLAGPACVRFVRPIEVRSLVTKGCVEVSNLLAFLTTRAAVQVAALDVLELDFSDETHIEPLPAFFRSVASKITRLAIRTNFVDFSESPDGECYSSERHAS